MKLAQALDNLNKCFVAPDTIDGSKLKDSLAFRISLTVVDTAIKKGEITEKDFMKSLKSKKSWFADNK